MWMKISVIVGQRREIEAAGAYIFRRGLHIEQVVLGRVAIEFPGFLSRIGQ